MQTTNEKTIINKMEKPNINNLNKKGERYYKGIKCINNYEFITLISSIEQIEEVFSKVNEIDNYKEIDPELNKGLKQWEAKYRELTLYLNTFYKINENNEFTKRLDISNDVITWGGGILSGVISSVSSLPTIMGIAFETIALRNKWAMASMFN